MTWGEFKKWVEEKNVLDEHEIEYIDFTLEPNFGVSKWIDENGKTSFNIC